MKSTTSKFRIILLLAFDCCQLTTANCLAQVPQAISYQAVARDTLGNPRPNQIISLRFSNHNSTPGGAILYKETQSATTNLLGLFTSNIGQGTVIFLLLIRLPIAIGTAFCILNSAHTQVRSS